MAEPYNYLSAVQDSARRAAPFLYAAPPPPPPPGMGLPPMPSPDLGLRPLPPAGASAVPPPAATPAPPRAPTAAELFRAGVERAQQANGGKPLDEKQFAQVKDDYFNTVVGPHLLQNKATEGQVKLQRAAFDTKARQFYENYVKEQGPALEQADETGSFLGSVGQGLRDLGVGAIAGLGQLVPGAEALADYGIRAARAQAQTILHPIGTARAVANTVRDGLGDEDAGEGIYGLLARRFGEPTFLGRDAAERAEGIRGGEELLLSGQGLQARRELASQFRDAEGLEEYLGAVKDNIGALPSYIGEGLASVAPGTVLRAPKILGALSKMPATLRALTGAAVIGTPQSAGSTASFEAELRDIPLSELLGDNPEAIAIRDALQPVLQGLSPEEANKTIKDAIINRAVAVAGAANLLGDVGLAAVPGLGGAESILAGTGRRTAGRLARAGAGAATEAPQEALAGTVQAVGGNIAANQATGADTPLFEGAGEAATLGGVVGAAVGGGVGAMTGPTGRPLRRPRPAPAPAPAPGTLQTPSGVQAPPTPGAPTGTPELVQPNAPPTPVAPTNAIPPGEGIPEDRHTATVARAVEAVSRRLSTRQGKRMVADTNTPLQVTEIATRIAQIAGGTNWPNMTNLQRLDVVDAVAEEINKRTKVNGVGELLTGMREALQSVAPATPAVTETELVLPPQEEPAAEAAPGPTATPTPEPPEAVTATAESEAPRRRNRLRRTTAEATPEPEAPRPNAVAPAQPATGAESEPTPSPSEPTPSPSAEASVAPTSEIEPAQDAVARLVGEDVSVEQAADLAAAVEEGREGSIGDLNTLLRELQEDEQITPAQAKALRVAARKVERAGERVAPGEDVEEEVVGEADIDPVTGRIPSEAAAKQALDEVNNELPADQARVLLDSLARNPSVSEAERALAAWLAPLVQRFGVTVGTGDLTKITTADNAKRYAAAYSRTNNSVHIGAPSIEAILHEMFHAVTSNLLTVQNAALNTPRLATLRRDFDIILGRAIIAARQPNLDTTLRTLLDSDAGPLSSTRELLAYGMTNPRFQAFLRGIPDGRVTLWDKFKDALKRFLGGSVQRRTLLDQLLDKTSEIVQYAEQYPHMVDKANRLAREQARNSMMPATQEGINYADSLDAMEGQPTPQQVLEVQPATTNMTRIGNKFLAKFSNMDAAWTKLSNSTIGLERSMQALYRMGIKVPIEQDMYIAGRNYTGDIARSRQRDADTFVTPIANWLGKAFTEGGFEAVDTAQFARRIDRFFQAHHLLTERIPDLWAEQVELRDGRGVDRDDAIEDYWAGGITETEMVARIRALAAEYAVTPMEQWAEDEGHIQDTARLKEVLADLAKQGYTAESLAPLNDLVQGVNQRATEHAVASGLIAERDPWVRGRAWQWYVPIKGHPQASERAADMDIVPENAVTRAFRKRDVAVMKGRQTYGENAIAQAVIDMGNMSDAAAEYNLKRPAFELALEHTKALGAKIRTLTGTPKQGYIETVRTRNKKTGKVSTREVWHAKLPSPADGFVFNDGETHHVVTLPTDESAGGQLLKGLKGFRSIINPGEVPIVGGALEKVGGATNVLSRLYTTWSLTWQAMTAFLRDATQVPTVLAIELHENPLQAGKFFASYAANLGRNVLATSIPEFRALGGNRAAFEEYAKQHPDSYAAWQVRLEESGGSTAFVQSFNQQSAQEDIFRKVKAAEQGGAVTLAKGAYGLWGTLTSNWASLVEYKTRTAAFKALVQDYGMLEREAAARVKGILDYGQSGEWGRIINAGHAFYRVGATDLDTIRRAFTEPDGTINLRKFRNWSAFMAGLSGLAYMLVAAALGDDEDGVPRIAKVDPYTLTQMAVLPVGKGTVGFPIGLGLPQLLLSPGTLGTAVLMGNATPHEAGEAYLRMVERNLPVQPMGARPGSGLKGQTVAAFLGVATPTVITAPVEEIFNTNNFGYPIHKDITTDTKFRTEQAKGSTPQEWIDMATWLRETTGIDMYPEDIRHLARAYGGQPASQVIQWAIDIKAKEDAGLDSRALRQAARLAINDSNYYYSRELYRARDTLLDAKRKAEYAEDHGGTLDAETAKRLAAYKALDAARGRYYKDLAAIRDGKLLSQQRKKDMRKQADSKLRQAVEAANKVIEATDD